MIIICYDYDFLHKIHIHTLQMYEYNSTFRNELKFPAQFLR